MLEIRLFGVPTIMHDDELLNISRRTTRALLYYLATMGEPVGRTSLATFLWPRITEKIARARLSDQLGKLRKALPGPSFLNVTGQDISLNFEHINVDVLTFKNLFEEISRNTWTLSPDVAIPANIYTKLVGMIDIWRTPGFIAGVDVIVSNEFDDWLTYTSQDLETKYLRTIRRLHNHERISGNLQLATHWLNKALEHDALDIEVNSLLLKTFLEDGQFVEAQNHFEYFQQLWAKEYGDELPEEIEDFRDKLSARVQTIPSRVAHEWPVHHSINVPYIGQEQVFDQIDLTYKRGGISILIGEAGAGKTRLVQEFYHRISPRPKLLLASCYSHKSEVPFHPWSELLQNYVEPDEWKKLKPVEASMLSLIVPEVTSWFQDLPTVPTAITARVRQNLFDAIYQLLLLLSKNQPVMLFLDDVHWADKSSYDLIAYIMNRSLFRQPNHVFLMAARAEEQNPGLTKLIQGYPRRHLEQVYLEQLTNTQTEELAFQVLRKIPPQAFIDRLVKETGGNPYFILETLQEIHNSNEEISLQEIANFPISESIFSVIQYRLQQLSSDAYDLLEMIALLGNRFEISVAEHSCTYSSERFIKAIDELQEALLITEVHESKTIQYAFVHECIRETILKNMPSLRGKALHSRIAKALDEIFANKTEDNAFILAQHYEEAEEFSKAFDYWVQGAFHAYSMTSVQEALRAFARAKELLDVTDRVTDQQIYTLYTNWSDVAWFLDNPPLVRQLNQEFLDFGEQRKSDLLIGSALDGLSDACFTLNQFEEGLQYTLDAIPYLERAGDLYEYLFAQIHRGVFQYMLGKLPESRDIFYQVLDQIPENIDLKLINLNSNLHHQLGIVETLMGYPVRGIEFLKDAIDYRMKAPLLSEVMAIYSAMGLANYLLGDFRAGFDASAEAIRIGEQMDYRRMLGYSYAYSALNAHFLGLFDVAWEHAEKALEIGEKQGHNEISALAYRTKGHIHLRLGDYQPAIEYFQQGIQVAGEHFAALEVMALFGYALASTGKVEDGLMYLEKAYRAAEQAKLGSISVYAHSMLLFARSQFQEPSDDILKEIEIALVDAQSRSHLRPVAILNAPFIRMSQRPNDYVKQLEKSLFLVSKMADPLFETQILKILILFKKKHKIPWQADADLFSEKLTEMASHIKDMPFENAWHKYLQSCKELIDVA